MKNLLWLFVSLLISSHQNSFAATPLVEFISTPTPNQTVKSQNTNLVFYTLRNNTNTTFPLSYSFSNNAASVFSSGSTCGNAIAGKSTCVLSVQYQAPADTRTDRVVMSVNFQGRAPLTNAISFHVNNDISCVLLNTASYQTPFCQQQYQNVLQTTPNVFNVVNTNVQEEQTLGGMFGIYQRRNDAEQICYISCGLRKLQGASPDENTLFELASVTKTYTASILGKLVSNGTINSALDAIQPSLPTGFALHVNESPVTFQQLATFSGGVCFSDAPSVNQSSGDPVQNQANFVLDINHLNPDPASGNCSDGSANVTPEYAAPQWLPSHNLYSNSSVGLLGQGLMQIQGFNVYEDGFNEWICQNITNVLEMKNSNACLPNQTTTCAANAGSCTFAAGWPSAEYASGYHITPQGQYQQGNPFPFLPWAPAGGIRSNVVDMIKFIRANLGFSTNNMSMAQSQLIQGMLLAHAPNNYLPAPAGVSPRLNIGSQTPLRGGQGYAWVCEQSPTNGNRLCGKIGGHQNFRSFVGINTTQNYGIVILFNTGATSTTGSLLPSATPPSVGVIGTNMMEMVS